MEGLPAGLRSLNHRITAFACTSIAQHTTAAVTGIMFHFLAFTKQLQSWQRTMLRWSDKLIMRPASIQSLKLFGSTTEH